MNLPESFINQTHSLLKNEADLFLEALEKAVITSIRLNLSKSSDAFATDEKVDWCTEGRNLSNRPEFIADPLFHAGAYYVQESSSMFLSYIFSQIINKKPSIKVLDLCAAPGGKSTLIASMLDKSSLLVSNEIIKNRVKILEENLTRWGNPNVIISSNDPKEIGAIKNYFDVILVDAPCSGEGMFRKDKNAIDEWSESNIDLCVARQKRILSDVIPALKPEGFLIYSTCTFNTKENEENIDWLATQHQLNVIDIEIPFPQLVKLRNGIRFYPHKVKGEGLFVSVLQKKEHLETRFEFKPRFHKHKNKFPELNKWLIDFEDFVFVKKDDQFNVYPKSILEDYLYLKQKLSIRFAGIPLGKLDKNNELIPTHALAMSTQLSENVKKLELDLPSAQKFLQKKNLILKNEISQGWYLITYQGLGLGWIKVLANRINNYLPNEFRILKEL